MIAGHTKFSCDQCFGTLKAKTKKTPLWTLYDVANTIEESSVVNKAILVGTHDGQMLVDTYDWKSYLAKYMKDVSNILSFHHFKFSIEKPGIVECREYVHSDAIEFNLLKKNNVLPEKDFPDKIEPDGMSDQRKMYLYKEVRDFCHPGTEDVVAPYPVLHEQI